ncbi:ATP-dependent zinc metalloprotease FtsH [Candidatus Pacebacteria bacterium]|nr:ATP-dependent zinc metalloprotease FtsH [Candidatus Paceibacterota bacterium]
MNENQNMDKSKEKTTESKPEKTPVVAKTEKKTATKKNEGKISNLKGKMPVGPGNFWNNILSTVLLLVMLTAVYSYVSDSQVEPEELSVSQIAEQIRNGEIKEIVVKGSQLEVNYNDETRTQGEAKKETDAAITETLVSLGVTTEQISNINIDVQNPTGFSYWLGNLAPFLFPLLFLGIIIWFFTRSVKGAGMQALNFGSSKARMIDPNDQEQKVTFKDVAGAKEAKQELEEIVDFLKNPKKFLDIGAEIPKGVMMMGAPGTGKCITGDTILLTNKGTVAIGDVPKYFTVRDDDTVEGLDIVSVDPKTLEFERLPASHWYALGEQETKIVHTDVGATIEGTHEHPVVVMNEDGQMEFKRLDAVSKDEYVVMSSGTHMYGSYTSVPDSEAAYLLGLLVGDGCLTIKDRIILTVADSDILEHVQQIAKNYLNEAFVKVTSRPYDYEIRSIAAKTIVRSWGVEETYARHKRVPEWIRFAPKEYVAAFLRGLFDADGSVERSGSVSLSSASESLIKEVHVMLLNMGVVARRYQRKKKYNNSLQYYLAVYGDFVELFQEEVGFLTEKKRNRLSAVVEKQRNTNINVIPHQSTRIKSVWKSAVAVESRDRAFYSQSLYKNAKRYISGDRMPSVAGLQTFIAGTETLSPVLAKSSEIMELKRLCSGDFFFTKVSGIRNGKAPVFDLTVPKNHNFVANGLINHNTLLARAVAGEAGVPFFSISGSEFVEMFVGVGASRVRDLFQMAKKTAPAIIFVDEIDAVGRVRGTGIGGGNDEREQTLNQILVEMDGFEPTQKVIVMAATNRPDVLDPALLRPGRFDRRVTIDLPDKIDREKILEVHARKKPLQEDVNLGIIAQRTPGFSGADLQSLMNEGAILAARENRKKVGQFDLIRSIEKVMLGPERKSHVLSRKEREVTAYHEVGHALVASVLPYADPVQKISIISRGRAAGYTLKLPDEDRRMHTKKEFLDDIAMTLGGYVTEQMVFDDLTTGPSNDLQVVTNLARDMVTKYGMSEILGPVALEGTGGSMIGGGMSNDRGYSPQVAKAIDDEVSKIIEEGKAKAREILTKHRTALDTISKKLVEVETLEREEYEALLKAEGVEIKDVYKEMREKEERLGDPSKSLETEVQAETADPQ